MVYRFAISFAPSLWFTKSSKGSLVVAAFTVLKCYRDTFKVRSRLDTLFLGFLPSKTRLIVYWRLSRLSFIENRFLFWYDYLCLGWVFPYPRFLNARCFLNFWSPLCDLDGLMLTEWSFFCVGVLVLNVCRRKESFECTLLSCIEGVRSFRLFEAEDPLYWRAVCATIFGRLLH